MNRNQGSKSTLLIVLLLANLAFLAYLVVRTRENRGATTDLGEAVYGLRREIDDRDREIHERIRERTQARLEREEWKARAERLDAELARLTSTLDELEGSLADARAERDEHLEARLAAERRVEDAFSLLAELAPVRARNEELEAGLEENAAAAESLRSERSEQLRALGELTERVNALLTENEELRASRAALRKRLLDLSRIALARRQGE